MKKEYFIVLGIIFTFNILLIIIFVPKELNKTKINNNSVENQNKQEKINRNNNTNTKNTNKNKNTNNNTNSNPPSSNSSGIDFAHDCVNVTFTSETPYEEIEKIMNELDAYNQVGNVSSINSYTFAFYNRTFNTPDEVYAYCDELKNKYKNIIACGITLYASVD